MRVAIDCGGFGVQRGGDETYLRAVLLGLAELVDDAGPDAFPLLTRSGVPLPAAVAGRAAFPVRTVDGPSTYRFAIGIPRALARERDRVDLVQSQVHAPLFSAVPRLLTVADLSFLHHPEHYPAAARLRLNTLVPWQCRRARVVTTVSEFSRRDLVDSYGLDPDRVLVIPNAVVPGESAPSPVAGHSDTRRPWPYFLYIGNLHPRKNVPRLIEAFIRARRDSPALGEHRLVIAGAAWWGGTNEARLAESAAPGSVELLGRVSDVERHSLLLGADALVYPSLFEGFGLPPLEAMAEGVPVLASNVSAMPEVLGDAAILVDPLDVDAIAGGLVRIATEPGLRAELARRGAARAAHFTTRRTGECALEAYRVACSLDGRATAAHRRARASSASGT